jgi:hypothetical protein
VSFEGVRPRYLRCAGLAGGLQHRVWCSFNLDAVGAIFADGFESGDISAWSD